jgi:DUF1365 family protein
MQPGVDKPDRKLSVVVAVDDDSGTGTKSIFRQRERDLTVEEISAATIGRNLQACLDALRDVFSGLGDLHDGLPLKEAQVAFEIGASGRVSVFGTGAEVSGTGSITLTFGR